MTLYIALLSLFAALNLIGAQHRDNTGENSCEFYARKLGQPLDGWRVLQDPTGSRCIREPVDLRCAGQQYYDPETRIARCCQTSGNVAWLDEQAKLGYCCAAEHEWTGDLATGEGGCCPIGLQMMDGQCGKPSLPPASPAPPSTEEDAHSCGCHSNSHSTPLDDRPVQIPTITAPLSIQYGHCYILSSGGKEVGSTRENSLYKLGGLFQHIPFRICRSTDDCELGGNVHFQERFYLQDQIGSYSDPAGRMGWVAPAQKALKMRFTLNNYEAMGYQGAMTCESPGCLISLSGVPQVLHFNEVVCETDLPSFITHQHQGDGQSHFHSLEQLDDIPKPSCH